MIKPVPFAIMTVFFVLCLKWFPADAWNPGEPISTMQIPKQPFSSTVQGFDTVIDIDAITNEDLPTDRAYLHSEFGCTGGRLRIPPGGHLIADCTDPEFFRALAVHGTLQIIGKLRFHTLMTYPGSLLLSTPAPGQVAELACSGLIDTIEDPFQWGLGIIATGGMVHLQGTRTEQSLAVGLQTAFAGSQVITLESGIAGWQPGDRVYLSPTYMPGQRVSVAHWRFQKDLRAVPALPWEMASVAAVDDLTVTLEDPLAYDHTGGYAVHTSRNVHIYTEGPVSHPERLDRCHLAILGATTVNITGADFWEMGRTRSGILNPPRQLASGEVVKALPGYPGNAPGRYPIHLHHGSAHMAEIAWNVVHGDNGLDGQYGPKSGIVVHRTHANVHHNFVYGTSGAAIVCGEAGGEAGNCDGNVVSRHGNNAGGPPELLPPGKTSISDTQGIFVVPRVLPVSELHSELTQDDLPPSQFTRGECFWAWDHLFELSDNLCIGIGLSGAWRTWAKTSRKPTLLARVAGPEPAIVGALIAEHGEQGPHHMSHEGWVVFDGNVCDGLHCKSHWAYNIGTNDITNHASTDTDPLGGAPCFRMEHSAHLSIADSSCTVMNAPYAVHVNNGNPVIDTVNFNWTGYGAETNQ